MSKKFFIISLISLLLFLSGALLFIGLDKDGLPMIKDAVGETSGFAVYTKDGDVIPTRTIKNIKKTMPSPIGIIENPPLAIITDIYGKTLESMDNDRLVLIIYVDGLGYEIYKKAMDRGIIPCLKSLGTAKKALTVYPPITDVAFASMVTGRTPKYTTIHSREKKPLPIPTIFDKAAEKGKTSKLIEGDIRILVDEVETILNIDENKNGTIDDEIYERALEELQSPPHLLLVHFHSYDDFGHTYGPGSQEALNQLSVLDSYIENILKNYTGDVIITSDHGMHDEGDGGSHGSFSGTDLFIPIIIKNQ
ncbi:MAG: alkaline phosphatase family protein [Lutispora sp.]|nr:alkaline phosphatase family protein [Lutispora sp.]MDD4834092.1 alkaline phosphatase family protein [Lutispora sp.]